MNFSLQNDKYNDDDNFKEFLDNKSYLNYEYYTKIIKEIDFLD